MRSTMLVAALVMGFLTTESLAADLHWRIYEDTDFGCVLDYPAALFRPGPSNPDEPRRFSSKSADVYFRIQGVENANGWTPQAIREQYLSADMPGDVTYDRTRSDFVVLSGYRGESIFYTKVAVSTDRSSACVFEITYPREQKKAFDRIVTRMSRSLRSLN
ncbi:MAG TPA: hypothetical protein VJS40_08245 [Aestuariivirgaceae bacterium]|nr:hypothetical protein [Aestuariivirgaceae bacterium]